MVFHGLKLRPSVVTGNILFQRPDQKILIVAQIHVPFCMGDKLRLTASLRHQEA